MADLVLRNQCRSGLRKGLNITLNVSFPIWGILSPIAIVMFLVNFAIRSQGSGQGNPTEGLGIVLMYVCLTIACLLLKRLVMHDQMFVNQQGINLPCFLGNSIRPFTFLGWKNIQQLSAVVVADEPQKSRLLVRKTNGRTLQLSVSTLEPEFTEQLILAAQMWAPDRCSESIKELQQVIRADAKPQGNKSYTDLWEDELSRRFRPTAYIPLEPNRMLRNNTLKVISHLATGGLSALYLCQMDGKQLVVLKEATVPDHGSENIREKAKELFKREAELLIKLDHPGIVHVLDSFAETDRNYLLLEHINGADLRQLVRQNGPQAEPDVLDWAVQVATALKYLHEREQPIIHRDLTPDNLVLRNDGKVIIVDFGAANEFIGTATGTFVGKHSFIAPEQLRGKATVQSDIYAFGCTLYFLLTGVEPEALSTSNPKTLVPNISDELAEFIESCTQLETSDRYHSVAQMLPVLRRLVAQSAVV